ncbi:MAG: hypothetical protein M1819_004079 [Sarea resinae]|nr:MAG: hypothetical protein M1819_004079 [Sarea resinae]
MATRVTRASAAKEAAFLAQPAIKPEQQLSSPPATPSPTKSAIAPNRRTPVTSVNTRKRKRATGVKVEPDINELPHNLGKIATPSQTPSGKEIAYGSRSKARQAASPAKVLVPSQVEGSVSQTEESPAKKPRKVKANPYGLTPGETPYPDWPHPSPEECQEVTRLLSKVHGEVKAPATIPAPSQTVSGCGEVPSILDALIRTLLSAATTGANSSRAFAGLVSKFGILQEGIGKGSVDWDKVRRADLKEVFKAIESGGLAATKSKRIKEILEMVYQENIARRNALVDPGTTNSNEPKGAQNETATEKQAEISRADEHVLSLDYLHSLSSDDALKALIKYPGIGPKTASCVLLFCMQRPSFAVDTHVFRLCKWLKWVPPDKATRNTTYSHCEVRVPDDLKYALHQLLIRHGKSCPRCRAATGEGSEDWDKGCPIEHLVSRSGRRKGGADEEVSEESKKKKRKRAKKLRQKRAEASEEDEDEEADEEVDEDDAEV